MVEEVEYAESSFQFVLFGTWHSELPVQLEIEGIEGVETLIISGANEFTSIVHHGVRNPCEYPGRARPLSSMAR